MLRRGKLLSVESGSTKEQRGRSKLNITYGLIVPQLWRGRGAFRWTMNTQDTDDNQREDNPLNTPSTIERYILKCVWHPQNRTRCLVLIQANLFYRLMSVTGTWAFKPRSVYVPILDHAIYKCRSHHVHVLAWSSLGRTSKHPYDFYVFCQYCISMCVTLSLRQWKHQQWRDLGSLHQKKRIWSAWILLFAMHLVGIKSRVLFLLAARSMQVQTIVWGGPCPKLAYNLKGLRGFLEIWSSGDEYHILQEAMME